MQSGQPLEPEDKRDIDIWVPVSVDVSVCVYENSRMCIFMLLFYSV